MWLAGYPARYQIHQIILSKQCLLSEKAGYPALKSGRPDIRPDSEFDIRPDTGYQKKPDIRRDQISGPSLS